MHKLQKIAIILDKPQMGENIGAAARSMKNFGINDLRIINPRDGWPNQKAIDMAAHADDIIHNAKLFNSFEEAIADRNILYATTATPRDMEKTSISSKQFGVEISNFTDENIGVVFGCERTGLENREISFCNKIIYIPVTEEYSSINLAQAICIICYEFFQNKNSDKLLQKTESKLASSDDLNSLFSFLEQELTVNNFFQVLEKRPKMMINIRNMLTRVNFTEQEMRTFRGILNSIKK